MPAYVVVRSLVSDREKYAEYVRLSTGALEKHGGRFLARGGQVATLEGPAEGRRIVLIEFPDFERAKQWYASPEYQAAKRLREGAAVAEFIAVEGL